MKLIRTFEDVKDKLKLQNVSDPEKVEVAHDICDLIDLVAPKAGFERYEVDILERGKNLLVVTTLDDFVVKRRGEEKSYNEFVELIKIADSVSFFSADDGVSVQIEVEDFWV